MDKAEQEAEAALKIWEEQVAQGGAGFGNKGSSGLGPTPTPGPISGIELKPEYPPRPARTSGTPTPAEVAAEEAKKKREAEAALNAKRHKEWVAQRRAAQDAKEQRRRDFIAVGIVVLVVSILAIASATGGGSNSGTAFAPAATATAPAPISSGGVWSKLKCRPEQGGIWATRKCHAHNGSSTLDMESYSTDAQANSLIEEKAGNAAKSGSCPQDAPVIQTYYYPGKHRQPAGRLLCYVEDGNAVVEWTSLGHHQISQIVSTRGGLQTALKAWVKYRMLNDLSRLPSMNQG